MTPKLYVFQEAGVEFLVKRRRAILADDMGLGKTAQAVIACERSKSVRTLVICQNHLKSYWQEEIEKWAPNRHVSVQRGDFKKRKKTVEQFKQGYLVTNIESVRKHDFVSVLLSKLWGALIVDEAHDVKNRNSHQTRGVRYLAARIPLVYLLTGTPIMNRVDDLWAPLNILRPNDYRSFWWFVKHHTIVVREQIRVYSKKQKKKIVKSILKIDGKPIRADELRIEIALMFLRREKEEVFPEMPPKIYQKVWLEMYGEQRRIYDEIEQQALTTIDENTTVTVPGILAKLTRCRQIAISPGLIGGKPESVKIDALASILRGTDRKVLVFSQFAEAIKLAATRLDEEGIGHVVFIGETKEKDREKAIKAFRSCQEVQVFLATTQAGGSGLTLTEAGLVVFLDKHWTPAINEQAVDRTRPHMQKQSVQIIDLLARDSIDGLIENVLTGKVSIVEAVIKRKKEVPRHREPNIKVKGVGPRARQGKTQTKKGA